jgi:hypothetical protein
VDLGVSGIKSAGEGVLGTLAGVSSRQPIWVGDRVHSSVYPNFDGFRSLGVGVLLAFGVYELAPV